MSVGAVAEHAQTRQRADQAPEGAGFGPGGGGELSDRLGPGGQVVGEAHGRGGVERLSPLVTQHEVHEVTSGVE
jgi:hypothetical protein